MSLLNNRNSLSSQEEVPGERVFSAEQQFQDESSGQAAAVALIPKRRRNPFVHFLLTLVTEEVVVRPDTKPNLFQKLYRHFVNDSLYRNSITLMFASFVNGGFSFLFWIFAAHFYSQNDVGRGTALIAAMSLVAGFGTLGFNNSIIRFLPRTKDKNKLLNSAFTIVALAALLAGVIFLIFLPHISPTLLFIRQNLWYAFAFLVFVISFAINTILDNTFTAYRSTKYTLIKNVLINLIELGLVAILIRFGGFGIFASYGIAFFTIILVGFTMLVRRFNYKPRVILDKKILKVTAHFSIANYVVSYLNALPALALPILITNVLGAKTNAVYYIAYSISSLLFFIPLGIGNALFAEGSHDEHALKNIIKRSAKINAYLMVPAILGVVVLAPVILFFFGKLYSEQGVAILRILALSGVFLAISYPCGSILNILHKLKSLIVVNLFGAVVVIGIVYFFIKQDYGLTGVAWGWLIGWAIYAAIYVTAVVRALASASLTTA